MFVFAAEPVSTERVSGALPTVRPGTDDWSGRSFLHPTGEVRPHQELPQAHHSTEAGSPGTWRHRPRLQNDRSGGGRGMGTVEFPLPIMPYTPWSSLAAVRTQVTARANSWASGRYVRDTNRQLEIKRKRGT